MMVDQRPADQSLDQRALDPRAQDPREDVPEHARTADGLALPLQAVLSSLNVNLEDELNRYRRNQLTAGFSVKDAFVGLEDPVFDLDSIGSFDKSLEPTITVSTLVLPAKLNDLPPPPPNKRLLATQVMNPSADHVEGLEGQVKGLFDELSHSGTHLTEGLAQAHLSSAADSNGGFDGYLASSEKLIESLNEVPLMPEPVDTTFRPKRKTVSLIAGATLGLLGLLAGLGASYLMSNPTVAQRLAKGFSRDKPMVAEASKKNFDPPGPDLSVQEFVDIDISNLSSLDMPQSAIAPFPSTASAPSSVLPPIEGQPSSLDAQPGSELPAATQSVQSVVIPANANYYVTVPFTTEQGLVAVRQAVEEAFVRQFADGNRIQLAVFDSPEAAQALIEELKPQGVSAQLYGPTAE